MAVKRGSLIAAARWPLVQPAAGRRRRQACRMPLNVIGIKDLIILIGGEFHFSINFRQSLFSVRTSGRVVFNHFHCIFKFVLILRRWRGIGGHCHRAACKQTQEK